MPTILLLSLSGCDLSLSQRWNALLGRVESPTEQVADPDADHGGIELEHARVVDHEPVEEPAEEEVVSPTRKEEDMTAAERERIRRELIDRSGLLIKLIGTTGSSDSAVGNLWSDEGMGLGDIDAALERAGGTTTAAGGGEGLRIGTGAADIGDLSTAGGGRVEAAGGGAVARP